LVEFITLFLGALITGPNPVGLQVNEEVAALEIRLDGQAVATIRQAPWTLDVDFGDALLPHLLEAVAYAGDGSEVGRASQWVNLAPKQTELTVILDRNRTTHRVEARLSWQSLSQDNEPIGAVAVFDGEPLEVGNPRIIPLPAHDPDTLHHLWVALEFPGLVRAATEITFGGHFGDSVSSALTAVPVSLDGVRELPAVAEMQGWFRSSGRPLRVHSAESGPAEIVVVRSPAARRHLEAVGLRGSRPTRPIQRQDHQLSFVGTSPQLVARAQGSFVVFPRAADVGARVDGLRRTLGSVEMPEGPAAEARLADAVAVAGLFANQSARRRAVVLIVTGDSIDASQLGPDQVRPYLESIGVPFVVWNPQRGAKDAGRWGAAHNISTDSLLDNAYKELSRALDRQRIVWLDGLHLPQTIALEHAVEGVRVLR
jgi:hypothetical protein